LSTSMITAAISSSASVREWKPPVSTSTTTGRKPRKRRDASSGEAIMLADSVGGTCQAPAQDFTRAQRHDGLACEGIGRRNRPFAALQGDLARVQRQAVEPGSEFTGEGLQP